MVVAEKVRFHRLEDGRAMTPKFWRSIEAIDAAPFIRLLIENRFVTEADVMRAYGFTSTTIAWPSKVTLIASKARVELKQMDIALPKAVKDKGWKLCDEDQVKLARRQHSGHPPAKLLAVGSLPPRKR